MSSVKVVRQTHRVAWSPTCIQSRSHPISSWCVKSLRSSARSNSTLNLLLGASIHVPLPFTSLRRARVANSLFLFLSLILSLATGSERWKERAVPPLFPFFSFCLSFFPPETLLLFWVCVRVLLFFFFCCGWFMHGHGLCWLGVVKRSGSFVCLSVALRLRLAGGLAPFHRGGSAVTHCFDD